MPWRPLPRIAFAVATYPFQPSAPTDLPLQLGDELYIIEQGGQDGSWYRGYLVAPPSLLAGLTSVKGQTLEARVFSGVFPRCCVEVREELGEIDIAKRLTDGSTKRVVSTDTAIQGSLGSEEPQEVGQNNGQGVPRALEKHLSFQGLGLAVNHKSSQSRDQEEDDIDQRTRHKPAAPVPMLKIGDEMPTSVAEPLVDEIASCLREWHATNLHALLLSRQYGSLENVSEIVSRLDLTRRQLLHDVLTGPERIALRERAVWDLVRGNKMLSGEVIVRNPALRGRLLTGNDSAIELTKLQSTMSLLDSNPVAHIESLALHHLLLEIKSVTGTDPGPMTLTVSLQFRDEAGTFSPLSETFSLEVTSSEDFKKLARSSRLKTLFTDLSGSDIGETGFGSRGALYLVVRLQTSQRPKSPRPSTSTSRPSSRTGARTERGPNGLHSASHENVKAGRLSLRLGSIRRTGQEKTKDPRQNGRLTPQPEEALSSHDSVATEPNPKPLKPDVTRFVAAGLLDVKAIIMQDNETEHNLVMWSAALADEAEEEGKKQGFDPAIKEILHSASGNYVRFGRASRISFHLSPFKSPDADTLVRTNPTTMLGVNQTQKIGFSEAPTKSRSDIYLTLCKAFVSQAALLSHPEFGTAQITRPSPFLNLQLTIEVRDGTGRRIEHCIYPTSNSNGLTAWRTVVADQDSQWDQTICLKIHPDQVPGAHLIMSIAEAPEFPLALAWMPLWDRQAFIKDGEHRLLMHAYDRSTSTIVGGKGAYLSLPWSQPGKDMANGHKELPQIATVLLKTFLCSTEFSQDQVILDLIDWKQQPWSKLMETLKQVVFVPEVEIVKQRSDVFDALFALLIHKSGDAIIEDLIFNDLVTVLGIVQDRRFNLGPLVDDYIEHQFDFPGVAPCLMRSYTRLLKNSSDPEQARHLRAAFKVGRYIMKIIIAARQQQKFQADGMITRQHNFNDEMFVIFRTLEKLMTNDSAVLIGSKTLLVQHFHEWLPGLLAVFNRDDVKRIATSFVDSCQHVKGKLILFKIVLVLNYAQIEELWPEPTDRNQLINQCLRWLAPHWGDTDQVTLQWREQVRLCASVVAELLNRPSLALYDFMPKIVASYGAIQAAGVLEKTSLSLLFAKGYPFATKPTKTKQHFDEALLELAALMSSISKLPSPTSNPVPSDDLSGYILSCLDAQRTIIECKAYPSSWLSLNIYHHGSIMNILEYVSTLLEKSFLPLPDFADQFDMELWKAFFTVLLKIVGSESLALETFPEQKRRAVWKIAGDVRENGAELLRRTWDTIGWDASTDEQRRYGLHRLGGYQVQYVPSLVSPTVELCLSVHERVRRVGVEILQTMIVSEWALSEDLDLIEAEVITSLDIIFKKRKVNESVAQKLFIGELLGLFEPIADQPDDSLWVALNEMVATVDELVDLLMAAQVDSIDTSLHTLRLMDFMKDMQKEDLYIRYVHDLARTQEMARNSTEAGLALQLHAGLYAWDPVKTLPATSHPTFPKQTEFDRKEALYFQMIQLFEDGHAWHLALNSYRELAEIYEHNTFDFSKLARTQRAMGTINDRLAKEERQAPRYFKVTYRGLGFPPSIRDKQYIVEGAPSERMATFTDRLQKQHPSAQVSQSTEIGTLEGQYVHVSSANPQRTFDHPVLLRARLSPSARDYVLGLTPTQFTSTVKRHHPGTNVKEHWVEKMVFTTAESFPNILRRSEIVAQEEHRLTPIQTALERIWRKTNELGVLEKKARSGEDPNNTILTMSLLQLLDRDSSTGSCMVIYVQFLPEGERRASTSVLKLDESSAETDTETIDEMEKSGTLRNPLESALTVALSDHASAIKHCILLYDRPSLQATRKDLMQRLEAVYPDEARVPSPLPQAQEGSTAVQNGPSESDVHRPFVEQYYPQDDKPTIKISSQQERHANGHVDNPNPSGSGRRPREANKSSRMSLTMLKGALLPDKRYSGRMARPQTPTTSPPSPPLKSAFVNGNIPAVHDSSIATTLPHLAVGQSTNANDGIDTSAWAASQHHQSEGADESVNRQSVYSTISAAAPPSSKTDDTFGRSLSDSLGANISVSRFVPQSTSPSLQDENKLLPVVSATPGGADADGPPPADESAGTGSVGKKMKRFSIMRLGKKKSGNSVSGGSAADGVPAG